MIALVFQINFSFLLVGVFVIDLALHDQGFKALFRAVLIDSIVVAVRDYSFIARREVVTVFRMVET